MTRQCGDCTLCCKLLPVAELAKSAGAKCRHVRFGKGCSIYAHRPDSCRYWACAWRSGADSAELSRPDRSHVIIDPVGMHLTAGGQQLPAIQVWCDPAHPDAYLAPSILAFIRRRAAAGLAAIIRYNNADAVVLAAPELTGKGWFRYHSGKTPLGHLEGCTDSASLTMPPLAAAQHYQGTGET